MERKFVWRERLLAKVLTVVIFSYKTFIEIVFCFSRKLYDHHFVYYLATVSE